MAATIAQSSPCSFLETQLQRVPGSPLSPFYGRLGRGCVAFSPTTNSPVANVPDVSEKAFAGSPLLRQILRAGHKRSRSSSPSPMSRDAKRSRGSPRVPNTSIIIVERKANREIMSGQEQVVPCGSPVAGDDGGDFQRKLPENKEGVKPFDLFAGEDIFAAGHEE